MAFKIEPRQRKVRVLATLGPASSSPEMIRKHAREIRMQAILTHAMPPGNITEIPPEERQILAAWIAVGAPTE